MGWILLNVLGAAFALSCSSGSGGKKSSNGGGGGPDDSQTQWLDDGSDIQDVTPWGKVGAGIGAPAPETYLGSDKSYDPGCYRYFAEGGNGDGRSASAPAGNAIEAINAICANAEERANAKGKRLCLARGSEFRGAPDPEQHSLLNLGFCEDVTIEDFGDTSKSRPKILGSSIVSGKWTKTTQSDAVYRIDVGSIVSAGYTWQNGGKTYTDEERVDQLFYDGKKQLLARHPNFGKGTAATTFDPRREWTAGSMSVIEENFPDRRAFRDSKLPTTSLLQSPVDWTGATLQYKHATWITDGTIVSSYDAEKHELTTRSVVATSDEKQKGYFINNHLAALDAPGEWYFDPKGKVLYFYPPAGEDPNEHRIDLSFYRTNTPKAEWDTSPVERRGVDAFRLQYAKGVTLRNLEIRHFSGDGVTVGAPGVSIVDCHFEGIGETAIAASFNMQEAETQGLGSEPLLVENNRIENVGCNGILIDTPETVVANNTLLNVGSLEQYGPNGMGLDANGCDLTYHDTGMGIQTGTSDKQTVRNNFLERIGHNGIDFRGTNSHVVGNVVHLASVTKGDSGGIKSWAWDPDQSASANFATPGVRGSLVENNIVIETIGTAEGVTFPGTALGAGFFIDFGCQGVTLKNNIAARNTTQGMLLTINRDQTITSNTLFGNSLGNGGQLAMGDCDLDSCPYSIQDNLLVSTSPSESSMRFARVADVTADGNSYLNPFSIPAATYTYNPWNGGICTLTEFNDELGTCYSLGPWQEKSKQDESSKASSFFWRDEYPSDYLSDNLVVNSGFDSDVSNWTGVSASASWDASTQSSPSLLLEKQGSDEGSLQTTFGVKRDAVYEVRLTATGAQSIEPRLYFQLLGSSWSSIIETIPTGLDSFRVSNQPIESAVIFKSTADDTAAHLQVTSGASRLWFDQVSVRQVETYRVPRGVVLRPGDRIPKAARMVLFINPSTTTQTIDLFGETLFDATGTKVSGSFELEGLAGRVLVVGSKLGLGKDKRDFGTVAVGQTQVQRPVLASIGSLPLAVKSVSIKESGSPFAVTPACDGSTLAPSAVCSVEVSFTPSAAGEHTATLVISSDDPQGPERTVTLVGLAN
jgi:parallel beta-helix repeat protein